MSPLLETIKLLDGRFFNLPYHNARFNAARRECFGLEAPLDLQDRIFIPKDKRSGLYRCRVIYGLDIQTVEFLPHTYRSVQSLKLVEDNAIDYRYKYADRRRLHGLFEQRGDCDDILIVKNGCITDSYTANPIFFDGQTWWTPDTPLLPGTQRARLLAEKIIFERRITPADLLLYRKVGLINALQDFTEMPLVEVVGGLVTDF